MHYYIWVDLLITHSTIHWFTAFYIRHTHQISVIFYLYLCTNTYIWGWDDTPDIHISYTLYTNNTNNHIFICADTSTLYSCSFLCMHSIYNSPLLPPYQISYILLNSLFSFVLPPSIQTTIQFIESCYFYRSCLHILYVVSHFLSKEIYLLVYILLLFCTLVF